MGGCTQYLNKSFTVGPPAQVRGCEACIWPDKGYSHGAGCTRPLYGTVHYIYADGIALVLSRKCATRAEYDAAMLAVGDRLIAGVVWCGD